MGVPYRTLAGQFGLSPAALCRHTKHLTRRLHLEERHADLARLQTFLDKLDLLEVRLGRLFLSAQDARSLHVALGCIRETVRLLDLQEKIRHRLGDIPQRAVP
jgi:hypothetical protein